MSIMWLEYIMNKRKARKYLTGTEEVTKGFGLFVKRLFINSPIIFMFIIVFSVMISLLINYYFIGIKWLFPTVIVMTVILGILLFSSGEVVSLFTIVLFFIIFFLLFMSAIVYLR